MGCNCPKLVHLHEANRIFADRAGRVKGGATRTPHLLTAGAGRYIANDMCNLSDCFQNAIEEHGIRTD